MPFLHPLVYREHHLVPRMKRSGGKPMLEAPTLAQPAYDRHAVYAAPFRDRLPDGTLSEPYGPPSPSAQAAQTARLRDWSYRPPPRADNRRSKLSAELEALVGTLDALSDREAQVWRLIATDGHSVRWVAAQLGMRRDTVRTYVDRIRRKARLTK